MELGQRWRGKTALVTGASSGIGASFARLLAAAGSNLVLTARRRERLDEMRRGLSAEYGVAVAVVVQDLARPEGPRALFEQVEAIGRPVDLLVNNAGFGVSGRFDRNEWEKERQMLQMNAISPVEITKRLLPAMLARGSGDILFVSSIAAYMPVPTFALYAASKAFVTQFGEALGHELRGTGVRVTVLNPGGTATEFLEVAGMKPTRLTHMGMMRPEVVARIGLRAMARGRRSVIAGFMNRVVVWCATRLLPLCLRLRAAAIFQRAAGGKG